MGHLMVKTKCTKKCHRTPKEATTAARAASRFAPTGWRWTVYRCDQCRFDSGMRAWHWGHNRPKRRKV